MDSIYLQSFLDSTKDIIKQMTGVEVTSFGEPKIENSDYVSLGVASVISFSGKLKGRFILDFPYDLALLMVSNLMGEKYESTRDSLFLAGISEMNNIISGDANTVLNNKFDLQLRLAPPIVFTGKDLVIAGSRIEAMSIECHTTHGNFRINLAFQGRLE